MNYSARHRNVVIEDQFCILHLYTEPHCVQGVQPKWYGKKDYRQVEEQHETKN